MPRTVIAVSQVRLQPGIRGACQPPLAPPIFLNYLMSIKSKEKNINLQDHSLDGPCFFFFCHLAPVKSELAVVYIQLCYTGPVF